MKIEICADYGQVCVFDPGLNDPFNDWDDIHVKQGFAWRPGSVSFSVPLSGYWDFNIEINSSFDRENGEYIRGISVPFIIQENQVEIGGVISSEVYGIETGTYELLFVIHNMESEEGQPEGSLYFLKREGVTPAEVFRKDSELTPQEELKMTALPAL
ncbi:competence protein ComJ [Acanthopleuribacter pedis]|uniref:Uncharacterized protein n=1 Tax=Acanthopleuribacter pedis TaxID=442870 RepID=A0A8J7QGB9_9BACT|nr:competence protein ComJ [Acanthopleuribacter pedis]MBO1319550.1 hypothetical protein [Acanthopleuribacter pedis]